ncbi:hypothetical protein CYMTET_13792 [Cymbomonas tetramitiformis]|uniref:Uncharacterized protein n=1 Tax=Cymbomonas tetramitiformis TaxID=36881 RepID=A0AAE0GHS3_9CHLO|nr:hypothetical protein CYMTET_13792 [Cymbomonas tetramitiformis]
MAEFCRLVLDRPSVFFPVERFEAETNLFSAPEMGGERKFYGPTKWAVVVFRTLRGIKRLKENSKRKKLRIGPKELASIFFDGKVDPSKKNVLLCWLAFGGCFSKAIVTAKKQDTFSRSSVMLRGSVRFTGKDLMEVGASFSKAN